jgi:hypothetical protein
MDFLQKFKAIQFIRPNAHFSLQDDKLIWLDTNAIQPTESEIELGWVAYNAWKTEQDLAKATQKAALLDRLGITEDEAKLLLS